MMNTTIWKELARLMDSDAFELNDTVKNGNKAFSLFIIEDNKSQGLYVNTFDTTGTKPVEQEVEALETIRRVDSLIKRIRNN